MQIGVKTDKGVMREKNEDSYFVSEDRRFFIIADGVGGCNAGDIASKTAVESSADFLMHNSLDKDASDKEVYGCLSACIKKVNHNILDIARSDIEYKGMGTTIIILYTFSDKVFLAHMGDSRAYLLRNKEITQITEDHTIPGELLRSGKISFKEAENHPQRNVITKALGMTEEIEADMYKIVLKDKDIMILCTDGLYEEVDENEIIDLFSDKENIQLSCDIIVKLVNSRQSKDNITILALKNGGDDIQ